jgi:hypothetical protein
VKQPELDVDGYPTDATLEAIQAWPYQDIAGCLDFAREAWHWPDWQGEELSAAEREVVHAEEGERFARFATGGWSGNESVIAALKANMMVRAMCWCLSGRGGLHIFRYREVK